MIIIGEPIIEKRIINIDKYFQIKENIITTFYSDHTYIIGPNRCRNLKYLIFSHYN